MIVPASGGASKAVAPLPPGVHGYRFPSFFADGDHYAYYTQGTADVRGITVASLASGRSARIADGRVAPLAVGADGILYTRDGVLLERHLDLDRMAPRSDERPIARNVTTGGDRNVQILSASAGVIIFQTGAEKGTFAWYDRSGKRGDTVGAPDDYVDPVFSAHESKLIVDHSLSDTLREIDVATGRTLRLSSRNESYQSAAASPDGARVVCTAVVDAKPVLVEIVPGKQRRIVGTFRKAKYPDYFDATGETLVIEGEREDARGDFDLYLARRSNDFKLEPLLDAPTNETHGQLSPDGKFIAYTSDESGRAEVYVQPVPTTGQRWQATTDGGDQPQWRGDGRELFYLAPDAKIMSIAVSAAPSFQLAQPQPLFTTQLAPTSVLGSRNQYLATTSGQRFLILEPVQSVHANELSVITTSKP
jgi:hypothetical protein